MRFLGDDEDKEKCVFCNNICNLSKYRDKYICSECKEEISEDYKLTFDSAIEYLQKKQVKEKIKELEIQKKKTSLDLVILALLIQMPQYAGEIVKNIKSKEIFKNKEIIDFPASSVYSKVIDLEKKVI